MGDLWIVTTCMGRLASLRQTLGPMLAQDELGGVVVVDYSCPEGAGDWASAEHPAARVVRVAGRSRFNLSAARNAGARAIGEAAGWIAFVDSDVVLDPAFAATVRPTLAPGGFYRARSAEPGLGGTFVCARADFERVGGYDETYSCWGEEDNDLFDAFEFAGLERRGFDGGLARHLDHGDEVRTQFYNVERELGHAINRAYRILKWDFARVNREPTSAPVRRALYEKIAEVVGEAIRSGRPGELTVRLPDGIVPGGRSLSRSLVYRLGPGS